jgi:hypothetical protein
METTHEISSIRLISRPIVLSQTHSLQDLSASFFPPSSSFQSSNEERILHGGEEDPNNKDGNNDTDIGLPPLKRYRSETILATTHHTNLPHLLSAHDFDCSVCTELFYQPVGTP